jgi:uncharacterized protein (DUF1800 family)
MGNPNAQLSTAEARHLLRRAGFGAPEAQVTALVSAQTTRGAAADQLLDFPPGKFKPLGKELEDRQNSWIKRMLSTRHPLQEKLTLFWHDHFATSNSKVDDLKLMGNQNARLRKFCTGNFKDFVKAMNTDAAVMEFLDTVRNFKEQPNENYARELQELFTLGVKDYSGNPNYEQADIVQIARAFTGWDYNSRGNAVFDPDDEHDYNADYLAIRGPKVIYQTRGGFGPSGRDFTQPAGEGAVEIDQVIDIIFDHTDTDGKTTVARYIAGKLFTFFAQPYPKRPAQPALKPILDELISDSSFDTTWDLGALVRAIFVNDNFYATAVAADPATGFSASDLKSVKWPVDYVVSTLRLLNVRPKSRSEFINGGDFSLLQDLLESMGQILFEPPSVFGWNWDAAWISSATLLARYDFATDVTAARGRGRYNFHPEKLVPLSLTDPADIVAAATDVLGITDQLTDTEKAALANYLTDNGTNPTLDLTDFTTRDTKLNGLFALLLQSPAYQLH